MSNNFFSFYVSSIKNYTPLKQKSSNSIQNLYKRRLWANIPGISTYIFNDTIMAWIRSKFTLNVTNKFSLLKHSSIYGFILIYLLNKKKLLPHFNISNEFNNTFF